jgi:hypothetical protein
VGATYSKRRREDTQVLHPVVAERLRAWLKLRQAGDGEILFPVDKRTQLANITVAHEKIARQLLDKEPRVALLSSSTKGSASPTNVDQATEALKTVREKDRSLKIDSEFQADAAIIPSISARRSHRTICPFPETT